MSEPLNGQLRRREIIEEILKIFPCSTIVETGTYRGSTARYFGDLKQAKVISIEAVARYHWYARLRLRLHPWVRLILGDSRSVLRSLGVDRDLTERPTLFYLDAHWQEDLPLAGELREIARAWRTWVAVIDDFRVPGDPEFGFDDYGPGRTLDITYLQDIGIKGLQVFWPRFRASEESGLQRGCVVVTTDAEVASHLTSQATTLTPQATSRARMD